MNARDIEETGAVAPMRAHRLHGVVQRPVALTMQRETLRDALGAIGEVAEGPQPSQVIVALHQALSSFSDLWCDFERTHGGNDGAAISVVGELTSTWLMNRLVEHVRKLECAMTHDEAAILAELVDGAMSATRWAARWCWLRYKQPSLRLWANAAYLYEVAERWQSQADALRPSNARALSTRARYEFTRLLFAQWVSPLSLPVAAQLLFEQLLNEASARPGISLVPTSPEDAMFDAGSGRVLLGRQPASDDAIRYIAFGPLREEICRRATQLALVDIETAEPAKQLMRSVVGRRTRTLVRLGGRFDMLRQVYACVGYATIKANLRAQDQRLIEGFVLDRSEEGCRIRFERLSAETHSLCVGALLQVRDVFDGEVSLGIVRWLKRVDSAGWELGVWLMRGEVRVRRMRKRRAGWPRRKLTDDVFFIDGEKQGPAAATIGVFPRHSAISGTQLVDEDDRFHCDVLACIETGVDFDIAVVKINAMRGTTVETLLT